MKIVYILRGVPGSGKSTLARTLTRPDLICSADDFFVRPDGSYKWNASQLGAAHKACREKLQDLCVRGESPIVVDNTHTQRRELRESKNIAEAFGYTVTEVSLLPPRDVDEFDLYVEACAERNVHGVAPEKIREMAERLLAST